MLDKQMLDAMPSDCIFATGEGIIPELHSSEEVRWVAVRGGIPDWAIYYHLASWNIYDVRYEGDKVGTNEVIQKLVPCDESALKLYRR